MIVFLAAQAPELVSRDLRSHVLPLYFARPISRLDYPLAKLAAFILACLAMIEIPLLILYLGTIAQAHGGSAIWSETKALIPGLLVGLMWSVLLASIALAIASLTGRRAYATGGIAIFFLLTLTLGRILIRVAIQSGGPGGPVGPGSGALRSSSGGGPVLRLDQPVHGARRRAPVAGRGHEAGAAPAPSAARAATARCSG